MNLGILLMPNGPQPKALSAGVFGGAGRGPVPYLYIQVFARRGRCVGIGADGGAGVDVISAEVVYGVADPTADGTAVIPAAKTNTS